MKIVGIAEEMKTVPTEKPILFLGPMVRAILDGKKTMTRRPIEFVKGFIPERIKEFIPDYLGKPTWVFTGTVDGNPAENWISPKYVPGDVLCARETWAETCDEYGSPIIVYRADNAAYYIGEKQILAPCTTNWSLDNYPACGKWRPSIFLPKWAWRIKTPLLSIHPERLQEITEEDAIREGLTGITKDGKLVKYGIPDRDGLPGTDNTGWAWQDWCVNPIDAFARLWDSINGKTYPWASDSYAWVYKFKKTEVKG